MGSSPSLPSSSTHLDIPINVYEAGTGAVRSNDLVGARWDLISGAACRVLYKSSRLSDYGSDPVALVGDAIDFAQRFLGFETQDTDPESRIRLLGIGWWKLAAAIQQLDSTSEEISRLRERVSSNSKHYPYWAMRRLAFTCDEGAKKYAEENWLHGFQVKNLMLHGIHHMTRWTNGFGIQVWGEPSRDKVADIHGKLMEWEDELGHSMWSFMAAAHMVLFRSNDMCEFLLGQNYTITEGIDKMHKAHASRREAAKRVKLT